MVLFRALGWLLLAMAVGAVVYDGLVWWSEGVLRLLPLGELWSRLDLESMNRTQSAVQRHLSVGLWNWVALPILRMPALPMFLVAGTIDVEHTKCCAKVKVLNRIFPAHYLAEVFSWTVRHRHFSHD